MEKDFEVKWKTKHEEGSAIIKAENTCSALMKALKNLSENNAVTVPSKMSVVPVKPNI